MTFYNKKSDFHPGNDNVCSHGQDWGVYHRLSGLLLTSYSAGKVSEEHLGSHIADCRSMRSPHI